MNHVALIGRLTRDPQENNAGNGCRFTLAIDRNARKDGTKETDFPNIVCFGKQAESCLKYLAKGRLVGVEGRIQTGKYTNKDGIDVYTTDVIANRVEFLEWGEQKSENAQPAQNEQAPANAQPAAPANAQPAAPADAQPAPAAAPAQEQPVQQEIPAGFQETDDEPAW